MYFKENSEEVTNQYVVYPICNYRTLAYTFVALNLLFAKHKFIAKCFLSNAWSGSTGVTRKTRGPWRKRRPWQTWSTCKFFDMIIKLQSYSYMEESESGRAGARSKHRSEQKWGGTDTLLMKSETAWNRGAGVEVSCKVAWRRAAGMCRHFDCVEGFSWASWCGFDFVAFLSQCCA